MWAKGWEPTHSAGSEEDIRARMSPTVWVARPGQSASRIWLCRGETVIGVGMRPWCGLLASSVRRPDSRRHSKRASGCGCAAGAGAGVDGCLPIPPCHPRLALPVSSRLAVIVPFQLFPRRSLLFLASNRPRAPQAQRPRASGNSQGSSQLGARGVLLVSRRRFHRAAGNIAATEPFPFQVFLLRPSPPGYPRPCGRQGCKVVLHSGR